MPYPTLTAILLAGALGALQSAPAPSQSAPSSKTKTDPNEPVTMNGCVTRSASSAKEFMFTDNTSGFQYRLSGKDVSKLLGQPLEIVGAVDTSRLKVKTGLYPSPNVAAQAGAMDPGKAHVAALGGGTTGSGSPRPADVQGRTCQRRSGRVSEVGVPSSPGTCRYRLAHALVIVQSPVSLLRLNVHTRRSVRGAGLPVAGT